MNDYDLIERLRAAGAGGPAPSTSPDAVLAAGRKAQARRNTLRMSGAALGVAAFVVAGIQLTPGNAGTQTVNAAGDGGLGDAPAPAPAPRSAAELDQNSDQINAKILQAAMGDDFDVNADNPNGTLRAGTESASALPTQYSGTVTLMSMVSNGAGLKEFCAPMSEKGLITEGCVPHTLPDGRQVQVNFKHWGPTEAYPQITAGQGVRVLFLHENGVLAWTDLSANTDADNNTEASAADARAWVNSMVDRAGTAAADPDVEAQGFDGDHCTATDDTNWDCTASHSAPAEKPAAPDDKTLEAKKAAAAEAEAADAKKAAAAKAEASEPAPADEKAIAEKKAAAAAAEKMEADKSAAVPADEKAIAAKKVAAAEECAKTREC